MADTSTFLALFGNADSAADAIEKLRDLGIEDDAMEVISGIPFKEQILGRPAIATIVPRVAMGGAMVGLIVALFLIFGIPGLFPLRVGGQPIFPIPPFFIIGFRNDHAGSHGLYIYIPFYRKPFPFLRTERIYSRDQRRKDCTGLQVL